MNYLLIAPDLGFESAGVRKGGLQAHGRSVARALASCPQISRLGVWCQVDTTTTLRPIQRMVGVYAHSRLDLDVRAFGGLRIRLSSAMAAECLRVLFRFRVLILVLLLFGGEVLLAGEVVRRRRRRPGSASEKLDHHRGSPSTVNVSSARSMATRCATTSTTSAFSLWILAQRAIWFRFDPIRASSRVRYRSSSVCATVQVRTRPTDRRTRSDSDNPTERAAVVRNLQAIPLRC